MANERTWISTIIMTGMKLARLSNNHERHVDKSTIALTLLKSGTVPSDLWLAQIFPPKAITSAMV